MKPYFCTNPSMRQVLFSAILLLSLCSCREEQTLGMLPMTYTQETPRVQLQIPQADTTLQLGRAINMALQDEVISLLAFDEAVDIQSIPEAVSSFSAGYTELIENFEGTPEWEAMIAADLSYEDAHLLSIRMQSYLFTGGAHGFEEVRYLNFDKRRGRVIEGINMFANYAPVLTLAEEMFRMAQAIPAGGDINSTGFMFEGDQFYLPETIGFDSHGMVLHYNQYEVSSYADGPITITLPWAEVIPLLKKRYRS